MRWSFSKSAESSGNLTMNSNLWPPIALNVYSDDCIESLNFPKTCLQMSLACHNRKSLCILHRGTWYIHGVVSVSFAHQHGISAWCAIGFVQVDWLIKCIRKLGGTNMPSLRQFPTTETVWTVHNLCIYGVIHQTMWVCKPSALQSTH